MPLGGVAQSHEGHRYGRAEPILTTGGLAEPTKRSATGAIFHLRSALPQK